MIAVVTALIGNAESAPPVGPQEEGVRYVCVTDREAPDWECLPPEGKRSPRVAARWVKTHVHELVDAEYSVWIDASFDLLMSPSKIVEAAKRTGCDIAGFAHPDRSDIHAEAAVIVDNKMAGEEAIRQVMSYADAGFKQQSVLTTTGLLVRKHTELMQRFNRCWWDEQVHNTLRDQLSVDYTAWCCDLKVGHLPGHYRDNVFARYNRVRHRQGRA